MAETVTVRGAGGAVFTMDVPAEGTQLREHYDQHLATGFLTLVDAPAVAAEPAAAEVDGPEGTIDEVVAWVRQDDEDGEPTDGWPARAAEALEVEQAKAEPRKSLVKLLSGLVES